MSTDARIKVVTTNYRPRPQQAYLHKALKRFNVLVCHRRLGKTVFSLNHTIDKALRCPRRNPQYAYIAPTYGQAKRVAWDMLKDFTRNLPGVATNEQDLRMDISRPGTDDKVRIMLLGAENPGTLKGIYLDGVILDEFAECVPLVWGEVIRPALSDRLGWAIFIGTPKGQNHFYDIYQTALKNADHDWFSVIYKASETNVLPQSELEAARREMSEEEYMQEFECSFSAALVGSYFGKLLEDAEEEGRITEVPYDPALPVDTFWDLGVGDSTAIWFLQQVGTRYLVIDYEEASGEGLDYYAQLLQSKKYFYRDIVWPHDGAARDFSTGEPRQKTFGRKFGKQPIILPRHAIDDGIHAARMLLPKCWFDRVKCEVGLKALRNYTKKWNAKDKVWATRPMHNWACHGADAWRTLAMGNKPDSMRRGSLNLQQVVVDLNYNIFGGS